MKNWGSREGRVVPRGCGRAWWLLAALHTDWDRLARFGTEPKGTERRDRAGRRGKTTHRG